MASGDKQARNVPLVTAIGATVVALVLAFINAYARPLPGFAAIEGFSIDARFRLRGPRAPATDRIVIVGLDDRLRDEAWDVLQTRRGYARLIDALTAYDPKLIALDFFFSSPEVVLPDELATRVRTLAATLPVTGDATAIETKSVVDAIVDELRGDEVLAAAIARSRRVLLGALFNLGPRAAPGKEAAGFGKMRHGEVIDTGGGGERRPANAMSATGTRSELAAGAIGGGAVNMFRDEDGVTRRMPLAIEFRGKHYLPLGLAVALAELGKPGDTRYVVGAGSMLAGGRTLPVSRAASLMLDVLGPAEIPRVSAADILSGKAPNSALAGKLVFVGITYAAFDKVTTPLDRAADGVEMHATLAENILANRLLGAAPPWAAVLATLLLCGVICVVQVRPIRRTRPWLPPLIALAGVLVYTVFAIALFARGTVLVIAAPVAFAIAVVVAAMVSGLATEGREKAKLRAVFSQYVAGPVVDRILLDPARARLGGERKELTVLFSDIRGFSLFAEGMPPESLAAFLGEYLTPMTELVLASGGTLDKYIGDAVMAIWGAPIDVPDHAARACEVALRMQEVLVDLNTVWARSKKPAIAIGIGINTGAMAVGNMGSAARFDYTVLGDQVNLGARLEALTKEYGISILVGESTAQLAGSSFVFREIDLVRVKGRHGAVPVFELVGRAGKGVAVAPHFTTGLAAYRRREFIAARAAFVELPDDHVAMTMAARCEILAAHPPEEDWDGVYEQKGK